MSPELIGVIAAAIALGTTMLASLRSMRQELRREIGSLRGEMSSLRNELRGEIASVRGEVGSLRNELRAEMQAGFKELTTRLANVGDRLSKVEGMIEGVFWSARHQPGDKPREGAA